MPEYKSGSAHSRGREKRLVFQIVSILLLNCSPRPTQHFCNIEIVMAQKITSPSQKNEKIARWCKTFARQCNYCDKIYDTGCKIDNLWNHLRRKHHDIYASTDRHRSENTSYVISILILVINLRNSARDGA